MIMLAFYLLFLAATAGLVIWIYRHLRTRGRVRALLGGLLGLLGAVLFFPLPIHGGFTFPLEVIWHEWRHLSWQRPSRRAEALDAALLQRMRQRFAGVTEGYTPLRNEGKWQQVMLSPGGTAWLDGESGLLWLPLQSLPAMDDGTVLMLDEGERFCRSQPPQGYWALPSEAELALLWGHGGHRLMPGNGRGSVAILAEQGLGMVLESHYRGGVGGFALRCVAITATAPREGYLSGQIPLGLWNAFQLAKQELVGPVGVPPSSARQAN